MWNNSVTDFRLPQWFTTDVNSVMGLLHRVDVNEVAAISDVLPP
jgi:hypothetical protein